VGVLLFPLNHHSVFNDKKLLTKKQFTEEILGTFYVVSEIEKLN
jgi:hypothetical protein